MNIQFTCPLIARQKIFEYLILAIHKIVFLFLLFLPIFCYSQTTSPIVPNNLRLPPPEVLGDKKSNLPEPEPEKKANPPKLELPPLTPFVGDNENLSTSLKIEVRRIELTGNTIFSSQELSNITRKYENRTITSKQLQQLRRELSLFYIESGYVNSGAMIPDQKVSDGVVRIHIIEGQLTSINVSGNNWLRSSYVEKRIARDISSPLKVGDLKERLLLFHQNPLIERIDAELKPGSRPGQSELNLKIKETRPYQIGFEAANNRSPSIGGFSGKIWLTHKNLTGFGDALYFNYGRTDGLNDFYGSYSAPLNAYETRLNIFYQNSKSDIIEDPFKALEIRSESETFGISLSQPLYRTLEQTFSISIAFEHRRSKTFLGDEPFSFSAGVPDEGTDLGESKISVLRFSQDWLSRGNDQVIALRSTFNIGIDVLDTTINDSAPDGQYFFWLGQFQWVRRLPLWNSQIIARTDLQIASDPLLPMEKLSIGGLNSVRGYRENQLVRDNGLNTSLEWRIPVFRLPIPGLSQSITDGQVQLAFFYDFGWSENNDLPSPDPRTISSAGLGLRWDPSTKIHSQFYWGIPFRKIKQGSEHDIQDSGIHFLVRAKIF